MSARNANTFSQPIAYLEEYARRYDRSCRVLLASKKLVECLKASPFSDWRAQFQSPHDAAAFRRDLRASGSAPAVLFEFLSWYCLIDGKAASALLIDGLKRWNDTHVQD